MNHSQDLQDVKLKLSSVILDIRYATANNFTGEKLYDKQLVLLRHEPLQKLEQANKLINDFGYNLVIFDAYRPVEVQKRLREFVSDNNYVAEVSNHCKGITVDVTLADAQGNYLDMGTEYDDFTPKAHAETDLISLEQANNRKLLISFLEPLGFVQHKYEWWHFDYQPQRNWPLVSEI